MTADFSRLLLIQEAIYFLPQLILMTLVCHAPVTRSCSVGVQQGILDKYGVELIGAKLPSINKAEDRELFKCAMKDIGLKTPPSGTAETWEQALEIHQQIGKFPLIIRPAFTLGGSGGGIAYNMEEYEDIVKGGLAASVTSQVHSIP